PAAIHVVAHADWSVAAKTLGVVAVIAVLMIGLPRIHRAIPESLTAVIVVTLIVQFAHVGVRRIGDLPSHLPAPTFPHLDLDTMQS
ncbi:sodium-independent anion transporter, partial [Mycobacterium tuberculosis]|nr:sodium-independent anion transporter [Mycobacterium tuberculosis]